MTLDTSKQPYITKADIEKNPYIEFQKENIVMSKLRVWWIPQLGIDQTFYVPVNSAEEGKKVLDLLAAYDLFQLQNKVKSDYFNVGGLQIWDEEEQDWIDWYLETEDNYFDSLDEYCEQCEKAEELAQFSKSLFEQVK